VAPRRDKSLDFAFVCPLTERGFADPQDTAGFADIEKGFFLQLTGSRNGFHSVPSSPKPPGGNIKISKTLQKSISGYYINRFEAREGNSTKYLVYRNKCPVFGKIEGATAMAG
jgi:hypothetical protein